MRVRFLPLLLLIPFIHSCGGAPVRPVLRMERMADYVFLPVTIEGTMMRSYLAGDSCHYQEFATGPYNPDASGTFTAVFQSKDSIIVVTPHGIIPVGIFDVRLLLGPYYSRTFGPEQIEIAPAPVQKEIDKAATTIAVREYLLQPNRTYYARLAYDSLVVQQATDAGERIVRTRPVLEITDIPFNAAVTRSEATPATR